MRLAVSIILSLLYKHSSQHFHASLIILSQNVFLTFKYPLFNLDLGLFDLLRTHGSLFSQP